MSNLDSILKSRDITLPMSVNIVKDMVFPVVIYGCENWTIKGWALKNWCFRTVMLEKTLESSLGNREIKPVNSKGNQPWIFTENIYAKADVSMLWPLDVKIWPIRKDPDAEKDWGQGEKGATEDEMVGCHCWLNGREFEQTLGDSEGQGSLACCSPCSRKESDMTELLNNNRGEEHSTMTNKIGTWSERVNDERVAWWWMWGGEESDLEGFVYCAKNCELCSIGSESHWILFVCFKWRLWNIFSLWQWLL